MAEKKGFWARLFTAFRHKGEVSMSKVGVLLMALTITFVAGYNCYKGRSTPVVDAVLLGASALLFLANRSHSRSVRVQKGDLKVEQEFDHVGDNPPDTA